MKIHIALDVDATFAEDLSLRKDHASATFITTFCDGIIDGLAAVGNAVCHRSEIGDKVVSLTELGHSDVLKDGIYFCRNFGRRTGCCKANAQHCADAIDQLFDIHDV